MNIEAGARPAGWQSAAGSPAWQRLQPATDAVRRAVGPKALLIGFLLVLGTAMVLRRPDAVVHPQFWAEDGRLWFADAYNDGPWAPLAHPVVGYLQTISRMAGALALPFGLDRAPLLFSVLALFLQFLPTMLIVTFRFSHVIPSRATRWLLAAVYIALPNSEIHGNVTNAQWHLALTALLVLVAAPSRSQAWRVFDAAVLLLSGLSGPFVLLLAPVALLRWRRSRQPWDMAMVALTGGLALLQGAVALGTSSGRSHEALGAGLVPAVRMMSDRIVAPALLGQENTALYSQTVNHGLVLAIIVTALAGGLLLISLLKGPWALTMLNGFSFLTLLLALARPQVSDVLPQWPLMAGTTAGDRYFFLPMVAWASTVVWAVSTLRRPWRTVAGVALSVLFCAGAAVHWQYAAYSDMHPSAYAERFKAAPAGTRVDIPINPPGWTMPLTKR
ncbi:MAG: hypothetical protein ABR564_03235 [Candidatus Dormibacteria bacterium]